MSPSHTAIYTGPGLPAQRPRLEMDVARVSIISIVLLIFMPLAFYSATTGGFGLYFFQIDDFATSLLLLSIHAYASIRLAMLSVTKVPPVLRFTFWVFAYVWIANVPALQLSSLSMPWGFILRPDEYRYGLIIMILGLVLYELGGLIAGKARPSARRQRPVLPAPKFRLAALVALSWISVLAIAYVLGAEGVFGSREDRDDASGFERQSQLFFSTAFQSPILVAFFALLYFAAKPRETNIYFWLIFAVTAVLTLVANFPTAVPRTWFGTMALGVLAVISISRKTNLYGKIGIPLILGLLIVFPLLSQFRRGTILDVSLLQGTDPYVRGDFDVMQMQSVILSFTDYNGFEWGRQLLGPLFFWVPRDLWLEKPIGTGMYVGEIIGMPFTNVSAPLWAESYINFGIVGVGVVFGIYGWLSRKVEVRLANTMQDVRTTTLVAFFSGFQLFMLRGDLLTATVWAAPFTLIALVALAPGGRIRRWINRDVPR